MILGLEGEKSVEFFLVPAVAFHHVQFPHASTCEYNQHIVTGEDGKLVVTQVDVLVPIVSLVTYRLIVDPLHHEPPEGLPGQHVASPASEVALVLLL